MLTASRPAPLLPTNVHPSAPVPGHGPQQCLDVHPQHSQRRRHCTPPHSSNPRLRRCLSQTASPVFHPGHLQCRPQDGLHFSHQHRPPGRHPMARSPYPRRVCPRLSSLTATDSFHRADRPMLKIPKSFQQLQDLNGLLKKYRDIYPYRIFICYVVTYLLCVRPL